MKLAAPYGLEGGDPRRGAAAAAVPGEWRTVPYRGRGAGGTRREPLDTGGRAGARVPLVRWQ